MKKLILSLIATLTISIGTASAIETNSVDSTEKKATEENIQTNLSSEESLKAAAENLNTICTMIKQNEKFSECKKELESLNETIRKIQQAESRFK